MSTAPSQRARRFSTSWQNWLAAVSLLLGASIAVSAFLAPSISGQITAQSFQHKDGLAYIAAVVSPRSRLYRLKHDHSSGTNESRLQLFEDGKLLGPAHASHDQVRREGAGRYSHWGTHVWFSSSDGTDPRSNGKSYRFQSQLSLKPKLAVIGIFSFIVALVALAAGPLGAPIQRLVRRRISGLHSKSIWHRHAILLLRVPLLVMRVAGWLMLITAVIFLFAATYAYFTGWALPTAAPIVWSPLLRWAAQTEPLFYLVLFTVAVCGAAASWASVLIRRTAALRRDEMLLGRFLQRWGFLLAVSLFIFSVSAIWAGLVREGDLNWASIAGLLPFSDASGHFAAAHDQAKDGTWSAFALRRPIGAAFRSSLLFFSGYIYLAAVLLQAVLLALAAYVASRAVGRWRGVYAGLAFFSFSYVTIRNYLPTFLSEPLGIFWALLAIPFFVAALRTNSLQSGLIGLAMTTVALFIRPGGMFVIAALGLWLIAAFGNGLKQKTRTAVYAAAVVIAVIGASSLLNRVYGVGSELTGSNFSFTLCGLSIGTDYTGCINRYQEAKALRSEKLLTDFMYQKALQNIAAQPEVMIGRLFESSVAFATELPAALWRGYSWWGRDYPVLRQGFFVLVAVGLLYVAIRRRERYEILFWLLIWASVIASAALVHFDDGRRVMSASYPLLWMFFAGGLITGTSRTHFPMDVTYLARAGRVALSVSAVMLIVIPWLAHRWSPVRDLRSSLQITAKPNEHIVLMDRRVTGVLVLPDGTEPRIDFPTLSSSHFAQFIKASNVEIYQGLLNPATPTPPFGFVWAPRLESGATSDFDYIVPPEVIERRDVTVWRFHVREWNRTKPFGPYWFFVDRAEPLQ